MSLADELGDPENWTGGFYELAINLGGRDDDRLQRALRAVWAAGAVRGCATREEGGLRQGECSRERLEWSGHLLGTVRLPDSGSVVCGAVAIREDDGDDWLDFYLPLGALNRHDPRVLGFPFGEDGGPTSRTWREPIENWLAGLGTAVFQEAPFPYAVIGFEVSGMTRAEVLASPHRPVGMLVSAGDRVQFMPVNRWDFGGPA